VQQGRRSVHSCALVAGLLLACACSSHKGAASSGAATSAGWWSDRVFYEVFVRSFADSDGDGVGDLPGLVAHLDDLNDGDPVTTTDLGVGALWLMPIFPAASYHGYDATDYRSVDPLYGTTHDVEVLTSAAHARGMRVVLDLAINHTSTQHPWFQSSRSSPTAPYRDWYVWSDTNPGWTQNGNSTPVWFDGGTGWYYAYFWGGMPDLNLRNAAVEAELLGVMRHWLSLGVDGFRLDGIRHYVENGPGTGEIDQPETHALVKRLRAALQAEYPQALLLAETWCDVNTAVTYWGAGDEAQLGFFFHTRDALLNSAFYGDGSYLQTELQSAETVLQGKDRSFQAPFLSNHDVGRVLRALGGSVAENRAAVAALMAIPGTPFVYYGDEIGMQGGTSDPEKRTPFRWNGTAPGYGFTTAGTTWFGATSEAAGVDVASQRTDPASLWTLHRRLIAVRDAHVALRRGDLAFPAVTGGSAGTLAILRSTAAERVLFVVNYAATASGAFAVAAAGTPTLLEGEGLAGPATSSGGAVQVPGLAPRSFAFLSLQ
jgi:glycosidase